MDLFSGDRTLYRDGRDSLADVTGTYGITKSILVDAVLPNDPLVNVRNRLLRKTAKYQQACDRLGYNFRPLVFETLGGFLDPLFEELIRHRSKLIADRFSMPVPVVARNSLSRLDCLIQTHRATLLLGRALTVQRDKREIQYFDLPENLNIPMVIRDPFIVDEG